MNVQLKSIADKGDLENERLIIKVLKDADIGDYVLMQTKYNYNSSKTTAKVYHTFWFPDKEVSEGDLVIVYSKAGERKEKVRNDGSIAHFFYWKKSEPLWKLPNRGATLLYASSWKSIGADTL